MFDGRYYSSANEIKSSGRFLAVMWENLADPIITGRGEIGQPKLFAEIPELRIVGGTYHCEASWMGFRFLDLQATELLEPVSETSARAQMESFGSRPWQRAHYLYSPMRRSLIPDGEPIRRPTSLAGHFDPVPTGIQSSRSCSRCNRCPSIPGESQRDSRGSFRAM